MPTIFRSDRRTHAHLSLHYIETPALHREFGVSILGVSEAPRKGGLNTGRNHNRTFVVFLLAIKKRGCEAKVPPHELRAILRSVRASIYSRVENNTRSLNIRLHCLHKKMLARRNLLYGGGTEDIAHPRHGIRNKSEISHITNIKLNHLSSIWELRLKLMPHVILLLLIADKKPNLPDSRFQEMFQNSVAETTDSTSYHQNCVVKLAHYL